MTKSGKPNALRRVLFLFFLLLPAVLSILSLRSYPSLLQLIDISSLDNFFERKAMFLVFNFILLFLAMDSGLLRTPSTAERHDRVQVVKEKMVVVVVEESKASTVHECAVEPTSVEESVEDGEGTVSVGVDELNRRCEEFIEMVKRKMQMEAGSKRGGIISG